MNNPNRKKITKVVLDTSILFHIEEYRLNIFDEIYGIIEGGNVEFYIPLSVIREVEFISNNKGKRGIKAKTALLIIKKYEKNIEIVPSGKIPDKAVINLAKDIGGIVATSDKKLKNIALRKGLSVIIATGKKLVKI